MPDPRRAVDPASMPDPRPLSPAVARRFLAIRHFLAPARALPAAPESVLAVVDRLGSLQFDPLEVAGRNHDLVLHARVAGYRRPWTDHLLYERRLLFEAYNKGLSILPTRELPWHRLTWDRAGRAHESEVFLEHADHVEELLARIRRDGPISTADLDRSEAIAWYWGPTLKSRAVLEALAEAGILGIARRDGNRRYYDLVERLFPAGLLEERVPRARADAPPAPQPVPGPRAPGRDGPGRDLPRASCRARSSPTSPRGRRAAELLAELVARGELVRVAVEGIRGIRHVVTDELPLLAAGRARGRRGSAARGRAARRHVPRPARPAGLGPRPAALALRLRLHLGGLRAGGEAALGLLRPAAPLRRPDRRPDRAALRALQARRAHPRPLVGGGFDPLAADGFVPALAEALDAYRAFHGATRPRSPATGSRAASPGRSPRARLSRRRDSAYHRRPGPDAAAPRRTAPHHAGGDHGRDPHRRGHLERLARRGQRHASTTSRAAPSRACR